VSNALLERAEKAAEIRARKVREDAAYFGQFEDAEDQRTSTAEQVRAQTRKQESEFYSQFGDPEPERLGSVSATERAQARAATEAYYRQFDEPDPKDPWANMEMQGDKPTAAPLAESVSQSETPRAPRPRQGGKQAEQRGQ
jgi:hypothetical protein